MPDEQISIDVVLFKFHETEMSNAHTTYKFHSGAPFGSKAAERSTMSKQIWPPVCPSVYTLGEEEGSPMATRREVENAIFSRWEIARCFWATAVFLAGSRMTTVAFEKEVSFKA